MPTWHPNGKEIAFKSWNENTGGMYINTSRQACKASKAFTRKRRIHSPVWSKDNRIVVFKGPHNNLKTLMIQCAFQQKSSLVWLKGETPGKSTLITKAAGLSILFCTKRQPHLPQHQTGIGFH